MPKVGNKHFSYSKKGKDAAKELAEKTGKKVVYASKGKMINANEDISSDVLEKFNQKDRDILKEMLPNLGKNKRLNQKEQDIIKNWIKSGKRKKVVYAKKGMMINANMDTSKNMKSRVKTHTPEETAFISSYSKLIKGPHS